MDAINKASKIQLHNDNDKQAYLAKYKIFKALSDGKWHRNLELISTTKLSPRTLTKHLKTMTEDRLIDQKKDSINGKYAVLYKAPPELIHYTEQLVIREKFSEWLNTIFVSSIKDPLIALEIIQNHNQLWLLTIIKILQNKKISQAQAKFIEEIMLIQNNEYFIKELIESTSKIINEIDIDNLLINQAKRQKEISEQELGMYEELDKLKKFLEEN